jgi:hypothetical protein
MKKRCLFVGIITLCCVVGFSCRELPSEGHLVLSFSLDESPVSLFDIVQSVEIVPIETTEESLYADADKIALYRDTIFLFDRRQYALLRFAPDGHFINKIQRIGRGPQEYLVARDFTLDTLRRTVLMLDPSGIVYEYDWEGNFIGDFNLPKPPTNYQHLETMDSAHYVTWSGWDAEDEGSVRVMKRRDLELVNSFFPYSSIWSSVGNGSVFYRYGDGVYYSESLSGKVYRITQDSFQTVYEWDMGRELIDPRRLKVPLEEANEAVEKLIEEVIDGQIPFFFGQRFHNEQFAYALLYFPQATRKSLLYDRAARKTHLFQRTTEGIPLYFKYMNDEYAVGMLDYADREAFKKVVSQADARLLDTMTETDNAWLVRYRFK